MMSANAESYLAFRIGDVLAESLVDSLHEWLSQQQSVPEELRSLEIAVDITRDEANEGDRAAIEVLASKVINSSVLLDHLRCAVGELLLARLTKDEIEDEELQRAVEIFFRLKDRQKA